MTWQLLGPLHWCGSIRPYWLVKNKPGSQQFSFEDPWSPIHLPDDTSLGDKHCPRQWLDTTFSTLPLVEWWTMSLGRCCFCHTCEQCSGSISKSTAPISPTLGSTLALPPQLGFVSLLIVSKFWIEMCSHPDRVVVPYVGEGLKHGFQIGFSRSSFSLKSASINILSVIQ